MIFWIFIILLVMGMVLYFWGDSCLEFTLCGIGMVFIAVSVTLCIVMLIPIIIEGTTAQGTKSALEQQYESLVYKSKNGIMS